MNSMEAPALVSMGFYDDVSSPTYGQAVVDVDQAGGLLKALDQKIDNFNQEIHRSMLDIPNGSPSAALDFLSSVLGRKDLVGLVTASVGGIINSYNRLSQMFT